MKKLVIVFILLLSSNTAFAQVNPETTAKLFLKDGDIISNTTIDATGYLHGIEMNESGTAYLNNVVVTNAGTGFVTQDGKHGDGRGIIAIGVGAHIIVTGGASMNNSEDGFRATEGGKLTIVGAEASNNGKNTLQNMSLFEGRFFCISGPEKRPSTRNGVKNDLQKRQNKIKVYAQK